MRTFTLSVALVVLFACGNRGSPPQPSPANYDERTQQALLRVEDYVLRTKHWKRASYLVTLNRKEKDALVFWVQHQDDRDWRDTRDRKSVEIHFDTVSNRVVNELAFQ
jgi:hypothetical protein